VGLMSERQVTVACDNRVPGVLVAPTQYLPKAAVMLSYVPSTPTWAYDYSGPGATDLHLLDWSSSPGPTIDVYFNKLDYIPATFSTIAANNLPWLLIVPDDAAQSGTS